MGRFFFLSIALLICKVCFADFWEIQEIRPDLLLILSLYITLTVQAPQAILASCCLGVMIDCTSCEKYGLFTFLFGLGSAIISKFRKEIVVEHPLVPLIFSFMLSLAVNFAHALTINFRYDVQLYGNTLWCAFYTALVSPFLILFFRKMPLIQ